MPRSHRHRHRRGDRLAARRCSALVGNESPAAPRHARGDHADSIRRGHAQVDDPPMRIRTTIRDLHHHRALVSKIGDPHLRPQRQRAVRGDELGVMPETFAGSAAFEVARSLRATRRRPAGAHSRRQRTTGCRRFLHGNPRVPDRRQEDGESVANRHSRLQIAVRRPLAGRFLNKHGR